MPREVLRHWGLDSRAEVGPLAQGVTSAWLVVTPGGHRYVLKRKPEEVDVAVESRLLSRLAAAGLPVAPPIPTETGAYFAWEAGVRYGLYRHLPGEARHEHYTSSGERQARAFGRAIAQLHRGLAAITPNGDLPVMDLPSQLFGGVRAAVYGHLGDRAGVARTTVDVVYQAFEQELLPHYAALPQQLIHRDPHPGNMLFEGDALSGYIDFEIATWGIRVFDLAYCSTALLSGAGDDVQRRGAWLALLTALVDGYREIQSLLPVERAHLWHIQAAIQLLFVSFYAQHGRPDLADGAYEVLGWLVEKRTAIVRRSATMRPAAPAPV